MIQFLAEISFGQWMIFEMLVELGVLAWIFKPEAT